MWGSCVLHPWKADFDVSKNLPTSISTSLIGTNQECSSYYVCNSCLYKAYNLTQCSSNMQQYLEYIHIYYYYGEMDIEALNGFSTCWPQISYSYSFPRIPHYLLLFNSLSYLWLFLLPSSLMQWCLFVALIYSSYPFIYAYSHVSFCFLCLQ